MIIVGEEKHPNSMIQLSYILIIVYKNHIKKTYLPDLERTFEKYTTHITTTSMMIITAMKIIIPITIPTVAATGKSASTGSVKAE